MNQLALIPDPPAPTGKQLQDRGIRKVAARNSEALNVMRSYARYHCLTHGTCTSDDVRKFADRAGLTVTHPNSFGAIFRTGEFEAIGWQESEIESNHARPIRVWRLKQ